MISAPVRQKQSDEMSTNVYSNSRITSQQFSKKKKWKHNYKDWNSES